MQYEFNHKITPYAYEWNYGLMDVRSHMTRYNLYKKKSEHFVCRKRKEISRRFCTTEDNDKNIVENFRMDIGISRNDE